MQAHPAEACIAAKPSLPMEDVPFVSTPPHSEAPMRSRGSSRTSCSGDVTLFSNCSAGALRRRAKAANRQRIVGQPMMGKTPSTRPIESRSAACSGDSLPIEIRNLRDPLPHGCIPSRSERNIRRAGLKRVPAKSWTAAAMVDTSRGSRPRQISATVRGAPPSAR